MGLGVLSRIGIGAGLAAALVSAPVVSWSQDADGDGAPDAQDLFPCGPGAGVVYAPADGQWGMVILEDQWPSKGDLDFDDVLLAYNHVYVVDASGRALSMQARLHPLALGGVFDNGLGLHLPVPASVVASVGRRVAGGALQPLALSGPDAEATVVVSTNLRELFAGRANQINSVSGTPYQAGDGLVIEVVFTTPVAIDAGTAPHDLYAFRTQDPTHEIHLPQYPGTAGMNAGLFRTKDDGSSGARFFVDNQGLPFGLVVPALVEWPAEANAISLLYPDIVGFAASGGVNNQDWYLTNVQPAFAYRDDRGAPAPAPAAPPSLGQAGPAPALAAAAVCPCAGLDSPAAASACGATDFTWNSGPGLLNHRVEVYAADFSGPASPYPVAADTATTHHDAALAAGSYAWRVVADDGAGAACTTAYAAADVLTAPGAFTLGSPVTQADGLTVDFSWTAAPGASSYVIELDDDADFSSPVYSGAPSGTLSHTQTLSAGTYSWRVSAVGAGGCTTTQTGAAPVTVAPSCVVPGVPTNLVAVPGTGTVELRWSAPAGALSYQIVVDDDADLSSPVVGPVTSNNGGAPDPSHLVSSIASGTYSWQVIAYGSATPNPACAAAATAPSTFSVSSFGGSLTCGSGGSGIEIGCGGHWGMRQSSFGSYTYDVEIGTSPTLSGTVHTASMWYANPNASIKYWELNSEASFSPAITFQPNTTYYVRLVRINAGVREPSGTISSFTTKAACQFGDFMYRSDALQELSAYGGLTVKSNGNLLVGDFKGDSTTGRIEELSSNLKFVKVFGTGGDQVYAIDVDNTGVVWGNRIDSLNIGGPDPLEKWSTTGSHSSPTKPSTCSGPGTNGAACSATFSGYHFGWGPLTSCTDVFSRNCCVWGDPGTSCNGKFQSGARGVGMAVRDSSTLYVVDEAGNSNYNHWQIFNGSSYSTAETGVFGINNKFSGTDSRVSSLAQGAWVGGGANNGYFVWQTGAGNSYAYIWFNGNATMLRNKYDTAINVITNPSGFQGPSGGSLAFAFSGNRFSALGTTSRLPIMYRASSGNRRHVSIFSGGSVVAQKSNSTLTTSTTELTWRKPGSSCGSYDHADLIGITSDGGQYVYASDRAYVYKFYKH
jgi:LruC domain-containing protein